MDNTFYDKQLAEAKAMYSTLKYGTFDETKYEDFLDIVKPYIKEDIMSNLNLNQSAISFMLAKEANSMMINYFTGNDMKIISVSYFINNSPSFKDVSMEELPKVIKEFYDTYIAK